ncbi:hypothetical protein [Nodosilinea nodulosa]|uniref:hypothetical protein n=1 Tax=Nodosilinea nodulosa TaxID=416001 RepID=UPI0002F002A3|nr:hypothetical protein [Nodosilinea nodulosa]
MRVWVLASCGGLLALAAYSAEKTSSPTPSAELPEGDDLAQIEAQAGLQATGSSPMAQPELAPSQGRLDPSRLSPRLARPLPLASGSSGIDQTLPQVEQLRERVQRLRAQHESRLSSTKALGTTPLPAAFSLSTPPRPVPQAAVGQPVEGPPVFADAASATNSRGQGPLLQPLGETTPPTSLGPNIAAPETAPVAGLPTPNGTSNSASSATNLGPIASANLARNYPIAPSRHQGYSAQSQHPAPLITTASTNQLGGLTAPASPRLSRGSGAPLVASSETSPGGIATQPSPPPAAAAPTQTETPASEAALPASVALGVGAHARPADPELPAATTHHQSNAPASLRLTPEQVGGLTSTAAVASHHSRGAVTQPETAIALPESLPLNPESPRLHSLPAVAASSRGAIDNAQALEPEVPQAQIPQDPELQVAQTQALELRVAQAQGQGDDSLSGQLSQAQLDSLGFADANPKHLSASYCRQFQPNAPGLTPDSASQAGRNLDASHLQPAANPDLRADLAETALALEMGLDKADSAAAACLEKMEPAAIAPNPDSDLERGVARAPGQEPARNVTQAGAAN